MTTKEFSNEFDIHYNSIASNQAPGLDLYEKSVFLSKAQLEIVKTRFSKYGNKYQRGFEESTKRRIDLNQLLDTHIGYPLEVNASENLHDNSIFFPLASDTMFIVQESAKLISNDKCVNGNYVKVVPKTHDEYLIQIENPFKRPDKSNVWRLDHSNLNTGIKNVELITSEKSIAEYKVRYLRYPKPIILTNLNEKFPGEGLSIDNYSNEQTSELDASIHREILDKAIEIATMDYKPAELMARTQNNLNNE